MNQLGDFRGLCPMCYKPVKNEDDSRILGIGDRDEVYHTACLHEYVQQNSPEGVDTPSLGMSLLEEYKQLLIGHNSSKRINWIAENGPLWAATGRLLKEKREAFNVKPKHIADAMSVSLARIKRFESGEPVRDANLLLSGYVSLLYIFELEHRYLNLKNYLQHLQIPIPEHHVFPGGV